MGGVLNRKPDEDRNIVSKAGQKKIIDLPLNR